MSDKGIQCGQNGSACGGIRNHYWTKGRTNDMLRDYKRNAIVCINNYIESKYNIRFYGRELNDMLFFSNNIKSSRWRHNEHDCVLNHQHHDCLLNPGADQKTSNLHVTGLWIHRWPVNSPHKGQVTREMLPFDDVIISRAERLPWYMSSTITWECWHISTNKCQK